MALYRGSPLYYDKPLVFCLESTARVRRQFNAANNMQSQDDQAPAHPAVQMTIQSRPLGMQQNPNACLLSGPSTLPAPFPGRTPLGHQHITNAQMNGMVNSFNDLSTDQDMYDAQLANALANLDPSVTTGQRGCTQSRYCFDCGCIYHSPVCQCCHAPDSLALPGTTMQVEESHFPVHCADCTILALDFKLEFAKQEAEDGIGLFYEDEQQAMAEDPEFRRQDMEFKALVARVRNERPLVNWWTKVQGANR